MHIKNRRTDFNADTRGKPLIWVLCLVGSIGAGCAAIPLLIPPLVQFGANLLSTAAKNYDTPYKDDLQNLLVAVQDKGSPGTPPGLMANPYLPDESTDAQTTKIQEADPQVESGNSDVEPISLDVLLLKKHVVNGVKSYVPIQDGDTLRDGRGDPQAGDKFRIMFRANTDCYVYVIAIDGSAWAQGLFPPAGNPFVNPVKQGQQVVLPEGSNWYSLDQFTGIETIFFVASHERRPDIEDILTTITGRERHPTDTPVSVTEPPIIPHGYSGAKASHSPFVLSTSQGGHHNFHPTTFIAETAGEALRVTRWFRHQ